MKILVAAASPWSGLADTATLLAEAGLKPAQPAPVGAAVFQSAADWHTQLLQTLDLDPEGLNASGPLPVGKLWEDLAVGLLRANLGPTDWFLADTRATWTLDFWASTDPQARFLLLYLPAEAALYAARQQALATQPKGTQAAEAWDATAAAQAWLRHNRQLLRAAQTYATRTLLVNAQQAQLHPQRLLTTVADALGVQTATPVDLDPWDGPIYLSAPIEALVAPALAAELRALNRQLREAQTPLLSGGTQLVLAPDAQTSALKAPGLLGWLGKSKQAEQALASAHAELAHTQADLGHAQDLITALASKKERLRHSLAHAEEAHTNTLTVLQQAKDEAHEKSGQLAHSQTSLVLAQAQLQQLHTEIDRQKAESQRQAETSAQQISTLKAQLESTAKQATLASEQAARQLQGQATQAADLKQESELLLLQLQQAQEELETLFQEREKLKQQLAAAEQGRVQAAHGKTQVEQKAAELETQVQKERLAHSQAIKNANDQAEQTKQALAAARAQSDKALVSQQQATDKAQSETAAAKKALQQLTAKADDAAQENELLLLQLMQAQEELVEYYEQKNEFEKLYEAFKARWERLEKRLPNYVDFGVIEIAGFDHAGEVPSVTWRVKDFAHGGTVVPEFLFQTVLDQGHPGIGLCDSADALAPTFAPMLLGRDAAQLQRFRAHSTQGFRQLLAGATILEQLEASQWLGFPWPQGFDPGFWQSSLKLLVAQLKLLPPTLRFNEVRLKRELVNLDYEHLWLEFHGLSCGATYLKKFEVRLGASNVMPGGFSRYPKFEVPLIDGKHKPFESWFAESMDEHGAKLELRFALDQPALDRAVYAKLNEEDRLFMLRLVQAMPDALKRLEAQSAGIHRPWATWQSFAQAAVDVIKVLQAVEAKPTQSGRAVAEAANPPAASEPAKKPVGAASLVPRKRAAAAKVISIAPAPATRSKAAGKTPRSAPAA